jgi:hypothetical protein
VGTRPRQSNSFKLHSIVVASLDDAGLVAVGDLVITNSQHKIKPLITHQLLFCAVGGVMAHTALFVGLTDANGAAHSASLLVIAHHSTTKAEAGAVKE